VLDCDVQWVRGADDDADDERCMPHERAIEGPAVKPTIAPATAPTGPSTTAPDTAPSAASPARSCALASNEMSKPAISAPTRKILMASPPANRLPKGLRKCGGRKDDKVLELTKKPASGVWCCVFDFSMVPKWQ
jgi:hypothetical protein